MQSGILSQHLRIVLDHGCCLQQNDACACSKHGDMQYLPKDTDKACRDQNTADETVTDQLGNACCNLGPNRALQGIKGNSVNIVMTKVQFDAGALKTQVLQNRQ